MTDPFFAGLANPVPAIAAKDALIRQNLLGWSPRVQSPWFELVGVEDLIHLFALYDHHFFADRLTARLRQDSLPPVEFRFSNRMTRAAGKTILQRERRRVAGQVVETTRFQIILSTLLLFQTIRDGPVLSQPPRAIEVAGVVCTDRTGRLAPDLRA